MGQRNIPSPSPSPSPRRGPEPVIFYTPAECRTTELQGTGVELGHFQ